MPAESKGYQYNFYLTRLHMKNLYNLTQMGPKLMARLQLLSAAVNMTPMLPMGRRLSYCLRLHNRARGSCRNLGLGSNCIQGIQDIIGCELQRV
jgi:hypothetical protein